MCACVSKAGENGWLYEPGTKERITAKDRTLHERRELARWVALRIMPHEARTRAWLSRRVPPDEADEVIQDAYCRLAMLHDVSHIDAPEAYFFSIVRNLLVRRLKRQRIVSIELVAEIDAFVEDGNPSPEEVVGGRRDYAKVMAIMAGLPERCRRIVQLRKMEGWSQREIADHLGTTEKAIEKQIWLGVKAIRAAWADVESPGADHPIRHRSGSQNR